jgi:hypothetical protein
MLIVENGEVNWPSGPLVTADQADAYAAARGWSDWAALTAERKSGAILDASTYVRASYRPPAEASPSVEGQISEAVIEAARLSLTSPLIGGDKAGQAARKSVKAGSVAVEYEASSSESRNAARLALVAGLLRYAGVFAIGSSTNVRLAKS